MRYLQQICHSVLLLAFHVAAQNAEYGVDVSAPMHHAKVSTNYAEYPWNSGSEVPVPDEYKDMVVQPLGNRQALYDEMVQGCVEHYGTKGHACLEYEYDRVEMNMRQPQSMENYTEIGFKKIRTPEHVWKLVREFWDRNKDDQSLENWPAGNSYTNHWSSPTRIVNIENTKLRGGGFPLRQQIWDAARSTIAEWTHASLHEVSLYGIRVYTRGSVLASHVDRLPLVSSAIICVDTDVDEPWPLEVIGHDGRAHNVTMEPGDMVLYESHSIIHGRPFPLKGEYVANLFVHFEPMNHSETYQAKTRKLKNHDEQYKRDVSQGVGGHEGTNHVKGKLQGSGLPLYVIPGSPEAKNYIERHDLEEEDDEAVEEDPNEVQEATVASGASLVHRYAGFGELDNLKEVVEKEEHLVHSIDENGWTPLHEGARSGNVEVVRYLLSKGANVNHRTGEGESGYSALAIAHAEFGPDHPISKLLESVGGEVMEPEL